MDSNESVQSIEPDSTPAARPKRASWIILTLVLLSTVAVTAQYLNRRESPSVIVQRFCAAVKAEDWDRAYEMIDWAGVSSPMDQSTFVSFGKAAHGVLMVEKYTLGEARTEGDKATVPVTLTITIQTTKSQEQTETISVECVFKAGAWKVRPNLTGKLMAIGKKALGFG